MKKLMFAVLVAAGLCGCVVPESDCKDCPDSACKACNVSNDEMLPDMEPHWAKDGKLAAKKAPLKAEAPLKEEIKTKFDTWRTDVGEKRRMDMRTRKMEMSAKKLERHDKACHPNGFSGTSCSVREDIEAELRKVFGDKFETDCTLKIW